MQFLSKMILTLLGVVSLVSLSGCEDTENPVQIPDPVDYNPYVDIIVDSDRVLRPRVASDNEIPDTKLWVTERDCKPETISWAMKQGRFEMVERPSEPAEWTASQFLAKAPPLSANLGQITSMIPNPKHQAGMAADGVFQTEVFFAEVGDDVEISTYHWAPTRFGKLGELGYTVMVNYQPTPVTYTLWDHDRQNVLDEVDDLGFGFERRSNLHIVDVRIPSEAFIEGAGAYHLTVLLTYQIDHRRSYWRSQSYTVLYGDYTLKEEVCVREALEEPITSFEQEMGRSTKRQIGIFERESASTRYAMTFPGGGVWVDWSLYRFWFERRQMLAIVPLVDFKPIGPPIFTWSGGDDGINKSLETVDDRGSFWVDLEGREKKDVMVAVFPDPFMPTRNLDGEIFYEIGQPSSRHSNILSISSFRDDSDRCDPQEGPCIEWGY